ncbi:MAG: DNA gyrase C-terminal beta-propeller domain-containing protein [Nitrososphaerales archaeon]
MPTERPDLTNLPLEVLRYIQSLEAELESLRAAQVARVQRADAGQRAPAVARAQRDDLAEAGEEAATPSEPPTTFNLVTATAGGILKRTPRHLYDRQRRGGMGVFDLDAPEGDPPAFLTVADATQTLIIVTTTGRAFPVAVDQLAECAVRSRGESVRKAVPLGAEEKITLITPDAGAGNLTVVTRRGQVRRWRYNVFGRNLQPGTILYDIREGGAPAAACWSAADAELFIVTAKGLGIRFAESQVAVRGSLGIRVDPDDAVVGVASIRPEDGVFMLSSDGKGTVRQMAGFALNKAPGSGGKQAMKADRMVGAALARPGDDVFAISGLGKIIRFSVDEVPAKEGVVQGVNCMTLRNDECVAVVAAGMA